MNSRIHPWPWEVMHRGAVIFWETAQLSHDFLPRAGHALLDCPSQISLSGNCLWWSLNKMELFTIDISIWWNNRIFPHFLHFLKTLLVPSIWSERSTAFIVLLYFSIAPGCGKFLVLHWPWVFAFRLTFFLTFALSIVLIIETTLLSTHCNTRQRGSLSPIFFLAHSLLFFKIYREISPGFQDGACGGKTMGNEAFEKGKRTIEVMNKKMITSTEKKGSFAS